MTLEIWHITNKDLLSRGKEEEKQVGKLEYMAHYK